MKELSQKEKEMVVLVNNYYMHMESADRLLRVVEDRYAEMGLYLKHYIKQRHSFIMKQFGVLKTANETFMKEYQESFEGRWSQYDDLMKAANFILRTGLFICDRCGNAETSEAMEKRIENYLRRLPSSGYMTNKTIDNLKIR